MQTTDEGGDEVKDDAVRSWTIYVCPKNCGYWETALDVEGWPGARCTLKNHDSVDEVPELVPVEVVPKADYDRAIEERDHERSEVDWKKKALRKCREAHLAAEAERDTALARIAELEKERDEERDRASAEFKAKNRYYNDWLAFNEATLVTQTKAIEREARELRKVGDHAFADRLDSILTDHPLAYQLANNERTS